MFPYIGNNNPIWRIFQRGGSTTNQSYCLYIYIAQFNPFYMILMIPISYCLYIYIHIYIYINKPWILDDWNPSIVRFQEAMLDKKLLPFWAVHWRLPGWILPALQGVKKGEREEHVFFLNESMIEYGCQWMSTSQNWDSFWEMNGWTWPRKVGVSNLQRSKRESFVLLS